MSLILNIETATDICSVGLSEKGVLRAKAQSGAPYEHASRISLLIEACFREAGCSLEETDAIAVSRGPGSYTSLRVGTSIAKGICYALDKPLIAVDTLRAIALASRRNTDEGFLYCPMIDARRMEVYTALYDERGKEIDPAKARLIDEESFRKLFEEGHTLVFSGNGSAKCRPVIQHQHALFREVYCDAAHLAPLAEKAFREGRFEDTAYYAPFYLKPPNITKAKPVL